MCVRCVVVVIFVAFISTLEAISMDCIIRLITSHQHRHYYQPSIVMNVVFLIYFFALALSTSHWSRDYHKFVYSTRANTAAGRNVSVCVSVYVYTHILLRFFNSFLGVCHWQATSTNTESGWAPHVACWERRPTARAAGWHNFLAIDWQLRHFVAHLQTGDPPRAVSISPRQDPALSVTSRRWHSWIARPQCHMYGFVCVCVCTSKCNWIELQECL